MQFCCHQGGGIANEVRTARGPVCVPGVNCQDEEEPYLIQHKAKASSTVVDVAFARGIGGYVKKASVVQHRLGQANEARASKQWGGWQQ